MFDMFVTMFAMLDMVAFLILVGARDTLTGYLVPERIGDGTWMAWETSSVAVGAVAHP